MKIQTNEIQLLDGVWQIVFDAANEGGDKQWCRATQFPHEQQREITVPCCWERIEKDYEGVAFYRRTFAVPQSWQGKIVRLQFDAVNFRAEVWLNDTAVGVHEGGFTPFEFCVDQILKFGEQNTLIMRVVGPILLQDKRIDGVGPLETPQWRGAITGGIWQSVRLVATGEIFVHDVFIEPRIADNSARFHIELRHGGAQTILGEIEIKIHSAHEIVATHRETLELKSGITQRNLKLDIPNANYWSPDNPHLYEASVCVSYDGSISDQWHARFGMREFTILDQRFHLNGKPLYLKATFFEGLYPLNLAYPDSLEMARREIELAKEAGFNMIRPWRKPPPPMWLDLAEEMGVLTVGSLAVECMDFPIESANLPHWVENEVRESILRDRNRACVVQWELFNEIKRPVLKRMLHPMSVLARDLDPTRLILDESGGWAQGANIYLPYEMDPIKFNDIHDYSGPQINDEVYEKLLLTGSKTREEMEALGLGAPFPGRNVVVGLMSFFSELGYGSLPDLQANNRQFAETGNPIAPPTVYHIRLAQEHQQALKDSGFDKVYPDLQSFCLDQQKIHGTANRRMIEAVRCNRQVQGYCIHALTDGDWIIGAGLLDLFRNPKTVAFAETKAANQPRLLSIRLRPRNVYAERGTKIEITGVNELAIVQGNLKVQVVAANGEIIFIKQSTINFPSDIAPLFSETLDTKSLAGTYIVKAEITADDGSLICNNSHEFNVFPTVQLMVAAQRIAVFDTNDSLKPFLQKVEIEFEEFEAQNDISLPVFVTRTEAETPAQKQQFASLAEFAESGGTVVYLQGGGTSAPWGVAGNASPLLPFKARLKQAVGLWTCIPHIVKMHPIFNGLPSHCMMGSVYENVWAKNTLLDVKGETIVGVVAYDHFPDYDLRQRHYYGPGDTWWGADLTVVPIGKGRCILSQLRLLENLAKDPVADKILYNLIDYSAQY